MKKIVCLVLVAFSCVAFSQNSLKFDEGKQHYIDGDYEAAILSWESILASGEHSATLYFNLGNANFRTSRLAQSIYFYEKALQLAPGDAEIKNNLAFAQNKTIDVIDPLPKSLIAIWIDSATRFFSFDRWAWTSVVLMFGFVAFFLVYYFSTSTLKKRIFFTGSFVLLFLALISVFLAFNSYDKFVNQRSAIIFAASTQVRSEPLNRSDISFVLHEGTKVKIISEVNGWARILLDDGKDGWMLKKDLEEL